MLTPTHGFLASIFSAIFKTKWRRRDHFFFALGSIFPDLPKLAGGFWEWLKYLYRHPAALEWRWIRESAFDLFYKNEYPKAATAIFSGVNQYGQVLWLDRFLHSVFFWFAVILIAGFFLSKRKRLLLVCSGALSFHIFVDFLTHTSNAHAYFWPIYNRPVPGLISHENPILLQVEFVIWLVWCLCASLWILYALCKEKNKTVV